MVVEREEAGPEMRTWHLTFVGPVFEQLAQRQELLSEHAGEICCSKPFWPDSSNNKSHKWADILAWQGLS